MNMLCFPTSFSLLYFLSLIISYSLGGGLYRDGKKYVRKGWIIQVSEENQVREQAKKEQEREEMV